MKLPPIAPLLCLLALLTGCFAPSQGLLSTQPEAATGSTVKPGWAMQRFAVAAANPLATEAGLRILQAGGSALDAAVAVQMVLTLVEPQSSGIGGGAFLMHWDGTALQAWDGRETAPAAADERLFLAPDGQPLPFMAAVVGGRAVGVPGAVQMLEAAHRVHGKLPWARLIEPAIALAEQGFAVSPRLHGLLQADQRLRLDPRAAAFYYRPDGTALPVGHRLRNPALAAVLRDISERGSAALLAGPVAADIVARVQQHPGNPGRLSLADLAGYRALLREPLCTLWLRVYRVCGMPPPSSGHLAVMQILGLLENLPAAPPPWAASAPAPAPATALVAPATQRPPAIGADWLHLYTEAARLAFADRAQHVADPAFTAAPAGRWDSLLDPAYLRQRATQIGPQRNPQAVAGQPVAALVPATVKVADSSPYAPMPAQPEYGTSHLSIVDAAGRAVAMTTTVESAFGARLLSDGGTGLPGGFLLNNQLTDFSFMPADAAGRPIANRVQPGKRPRSSMSPTLVFDARDGRLLMSLGSPGGAAIIHFTAKTLLGTLAWGLDAQRAIDLPNFASFDGGPLLLEAGRFAPAAVQALEARGHMVRQVELTSGLQAIQRTSTGWFGGADPRREGVVMGE